MSIVPLAAALVGVSLAASSIAHAEEAPLHSKLHRYYASTRGYSKVSRDVMRWHKTTENGCVAFASTALRHVGVAIPLDAKKDGFGVSRITGAFARYLIDDLGWDKIEDADDLEPGDIVFTTDAPCCPGYPAHVMVFDSWTRRDRSRARFLDNQGFKIERPIVSRPEVENEASDARSRFDGFGYALRPRAIR
jgi:hypothetical protein